MDFLRLNEYDHWANLQVLDVLLKNADVVKASELLHHTLGAHRIWLARLTGKDFDFNGWEELLDVEKFNHFVDESYENFKNYIQSLTQEELESEIDYVNHKGDAFRSKIEDILHHIFNHATHHRAQILLLWNQHDIPRPALDYIFYIRGKR